MPRQHQYMPAADDLTVLAPNLVLRQDDLRGLGRLEAFDRVVHDADRSNDTACMFGEEDQCRRVYVQVAGAHALQTTLPLSSASPVRVVIPAGK